jgi:hypothetical protein
MSLLAELSDWYNAPTKEASPHKMSGVLPEPNRKMSELSRTKYADFFDGLDDMELPDATIDAVMANREIDRRINASATFINEVAENRTHLLAQSMRDQRKGKDVIRASVEAKGKLKELKYRESFCVPDALAHNMQSMISYYNKKIDGKRFKSKRVGNDRALEITRMR